MSIYSPDAQQEMLPFDVAMAIVKMLQEQHGAVVESVDLGPHGGTTIRLAIPTDGRGLETD